ncbi:MAG TPA: fatty acid desaturase [Stellaceae bacterium]|nr:fatty acid desaturase [Stellaceae bacterium]
MIESSDIRATTDQPRDAENTALFVLVMVLSFLQFGALPLLFRAPLNSVLLVAIVVATPLHWGLAHESFHARLNRGAGRNRAAGRALVWFLFMSWDLVRFGHLIHHDANRHALDRPEVLVPGRSRLAGGFVYFAKLLGGHAVISVLSALGVLVPDAVMRRLIKQDSDDPELAKIRSAVLRIFTSAERRGRIAADLLAIAALGAAALWAWGDAWPVFAASLALRWMALSILDNAAHYGTAIESGRSARNTSLPAALQWLVMNQNLHGVHHARPDLDWRKLPAAFDRQRARYAGSWLRQILHQFRGPLRPNELREVSAFAA